MLNFLIGFGVAILSGLGIGGGGLLVIYLALIGGVEQIEAQGINLIFFLFSSGAAMIVHLIRRRLNLKLIGYLAVCGCIGAVGGSLLAQTVPVQTVRYAFGALLVISGLMALGIFDKPKK